MYEFVKGCETYEAAINKLKSVYIKTPNVIFARHVLATRKQKQGENLRDFFQQLHVLSKDCNIQAVQPKNTGMSLSATRSSLGSRRTSFDKDCYRTVS